MPTQSVIQITGPHCGTHLEGDALYRAIARFLNNHDHVTLDFADITVATSSFFNGLFRPITLSHGAQCLTDLLSYTGLMPRHRFVLDRTQRLWLTRL